MVDGGVLQAAQNDRVSNTPSPFGVRVRGGDGVYAEALDLSGLG